LASLLPTLAEGGQAAAPKFPDFPPESVPAPPVPVSVRPHLPRCRKEFKPRIFRPGGVVEAPDPASLRARISFGKLTYSCPACHGPTEISSAYASKGIRCPHCYSAVRAPDPRRGVKSRNLEQDVQTLLKPNQYEVVPFASSRRLPITLPVWTRKLPILNIAACLVLGVLAYPVVILSLKPWVQIRQPDRFEPIAEVAAPASLDPVSLRERAENVVRGFLAAPAIDVKASYVRASDRVLPIMREYYEARPQEVSADFLAISVGTPSYHLSNDYHHVATDVAVQFADYGEVIFRVEHLVEGDLIEWESSVGYNPIAFARALSAGTKLDGLQTFRVLASADDYFNYGFSDPSKYLCVRLTDPKEEEASAFGYVDKSTLDAREIDFLLNQSPGQAPRPIMLELRFSNDTGKTRQVEITRLVHRSWRSDGEESIEPAAVVAVAEVLAPSYEGRP
jgi:DNA-directed RNA polymerase subunit RPC12/RpoP